MKQHLFNQEAPEDTAASEAQIPVIDLDPFFRGEPGALDHLADELRDACTRVGFFYIKNHGVPDGIIENAFAQNRRFHDEPIENKRKLKLDQFNVGFLEINTSTQAHSTVHKATKPNQNESFFVSHDRPADHPDRINQIAYRGGNYWPENLPGFREGVMAYFNALNDLGQRILAPIAVALGVPPDGLDELFFVTPWLKPIKPLLYLNPRHWFGFKEENLAGRISACLEELGPLFVKFGQLLSTRQDVFDAEMIEALSQLIDAKFGEEQ